MGIWEFIFEKLLDSQKVILLVVVESIGSSPGRQGFKMAIAEDGHFNGTIGGGMMEHKLVELAKNLLTKGRFKAFLKHQVHQSEADKDKSGMICSGSQTIAFYFLDLSNRSLIQKIVDQPESFVKYTNQGVETVSKDLPCHYTKNESSDTWTFIEPVCLIDKVFILGGGHVGLALCEVLSKLDFEIHLLDHRDGLNTLEMNGFAHSKKVIDFQECQKYIEEGENSYVVIVSFGYRTDKIIIKSLLGRQYRYIGMMGSKKKTEVLFADLIGEGYSRSEIDKVFAPIGVDIKSETTYEIAISIAAQLIKVKNSQKVRNSF